MATIVGLTFKEPAAPNVYKCPHCGKEYKTEDGLANHIAEKHLQGGNSGEKVE